MENSDKQSPEYFDCFKVHLLQDGYSFIHIELEDTPNFYKKLFEYFFDEDKLLKYSEHTSSITFTPTKRNFVTLFKHLKTYIMSPE